MKKIVLLSIAGLLALLVVGVLVGPSFIDWNAHKGSILTEIQDRTGRTAAIDGDIDLTILPAPALRITDVRVANFEGAATPEMLRLKELRLRISIGALLEGRIAIEQLDLIEPAIALEVSADGQTSWDFSSTADPANQNANETQSAEPDGAVDISLASVTIQNGTISYRDAGTGVTETVTGLNVAVSAPSLAGPFSVSADARYRDFPVSVGLKSGVIVAGQPISVSLDTALPESGLSLKFSGRVSGPDPDAEVTGDLVISGSNTARLVALASDADVSPLMDQPASVEGKLIASRKAVALNDARLRFGDILGSGAINVSLGDTIGADVAISVNRIDLDKLLADIPAMASSDAAAAKGTVGANPAANPEKSSPPSSGFSLPLNVNATLDLGIDAIQYRGEVIRQTGIRGALANGTVTLDHASALLPGGSDVSLVGFLQAAGGIPKFDGDLAVASDDLRSMLRWLGADMAALPADRLRGFSYSGKVSATPDSVQIPDFSMRLDTSTARGALALAMRDRIGFGLRLAVDQLNLDAYLPGTEPVSKPVTGSKAAVPAAAGKTKTGGTTGPLAFLDTFDANVDAQLEQLTYGRTVARKMVFDGQLVGGVLTVRKFGVGDVAGTRLEVKGEVNNFAAMPGIAIDFDVAVNQPEKLFRALDTPMPLPAATLGKPSAKGRITGNQSSVTLNADIAGAGAALHVEGPVKLEGATPGFDVTMRLSHPELADFVRIGAPGFRPAAGKLGALNAGFGLKGTVKALEVSSLDATAGPVAIKGSGSVQLDGARPVLVADLATSEILLDLFQAAPQAASARSATERGRQRAAAASRGGAGSGSVAGDRWSREPIDFSGLQTMDANITLKMGGLISGSLQFDEPQIATVLKDGRLELQQFTAGLFGGNVSGDGNVDAKSDNPGLAVNLSATGIDMARAATAFGSTPRVEGPISIEASLTTAGRSEAALVSALAGQGTISGKARVLATAKEQQAIGAVGIATALFGNKVKELQQVGGLTSVLVQAFGNAPADLTGNFKIAQGVLRTQDTVLSGAGARATTVAAVDLPQWVVESTTSVLRSGDTAEAPYVAISLNGSIDSPNVRANGAFLRRTDNGSSNPLDKILPGVLGGDDQNSKAAKPQDILRGLLKGLAK